MLINEMLEVLNDVISVEIAIQDAVVQAPQTTDAQCATAAKKIRHLKFMCELAEAYLKGEHQQTERIAALQLHHDTTVGLWAIDRNPGEVTDLWIRRCLFLVRPTVGTLAAISNGNEV